MQSIIFDVDDTLVNSDALDAELFCRAVTGVLGPVKFRAEWNEYPHVSDAGILDAVLADNGLTADQAIKSQVRSRFGELVFAEVQKSPCTPVAGARDMLRQLGTTSGYNLGIATGGWSHTARAKLAAAQLETNALPLASSDDHFARIEIMKYCARHLGGENQTPVYVGDGEWDLIACQELGWGFIGIGERLKGKCPVWIPDYSETNFPNLIETARAACHGE